MPADPPQKGLDDTNETEVARVLDELLTRAQAGPVDKLSDRIIGRTRWLPRTARHHARTTSRRVRQVDGRGLAVGPGDLVRDLRRRRRSDRWF